MRHYILMLAACFFIACGQKSSFPKNPSENEIMAELRQAVSNSDTAIVIRFINDLSIYHYASDSFIVAKSIKEDFFNPIKLTQEQKDSVNYAATTALSKLKKKYDEYTQINWYYNSFFEHNNSSNNISLYIGQKKGESWLRCKISYSGSDLIFFEKIYLNYPGSTKEFSVNSWDKKTNTHYYGVYEVVDLDVDEAFLSFLRYYAKDEKSKIKLVGDYYKERIITQKEKKALQQVIEGFDAIKHIYK